MNKLTICIVYLYKPQTAIKSNNNIFNLIYNIIKSSYSNTLIDMLLCY